MILCYLKRQKEQGKVALRCVLNLQYVERKNPDEMGVSRMFKHIISCEYRFNNVKHVNVYKMLIKCLRNLLYIEILFFGFLQTV